MTEAKIWQEALENGRLIGINGRIDHHLTPKLDETLINLSQKGQNRLLIDLSAVHYINSGGLRCLLSAWRRSRREGGDVVLCGLNGRLQELFQMAGFDTVFNIYPSRESALSDPSL